MLRRGFPNFTTTVATAPFFSSFRRLLSSLHSSSNSIVPFSVPALADSDDEENLDPPPSSVVALNVMPRLLLPRVVVYDGVCHLYHQGVKWVIDADKDKRIKFCCVQSKAAEPYLTACGLEKKDVLRRLLFVEGLGSYSQGSTAALRVLSYLPPPYSALSLLLVVPSPIREPVYDYIAKHRYEWCGRAEACLVFREKELLEHFIDWDELNRG